MFRILAAWCFMLGATLGLAPLAQAQSEQTEVEFSAPQPEVEMADTLRQDGKIYVVVAVLTVMLIGIFIFLFLLDRKMSRLERELKA